MQFLFPHTRSISFRLFFFFDETRWHVTNPTEKSPSWGTNSFYASQEIFRIFMEPDVSSPPLVPIIIWINTVHAVSSCSLKCILILSSHLHLCRPSDLFPSGFSTKTLFAFPTMCPPHMKNLCYDQMLLSMLLVTSFADICDHVLYQKWEDTFCLDRN